MTLLEVRDLHVRYGKVEAVRGVDVTVRAGEVTAVLGANGAGKTSLLSAVSGVVKVAAGSVVMNGEDITGQPANRNARRGMVHVPEGRRIIAPLTVEENLLLGAYTQPARRRKELLASVYEIFPRLVERKRSAGGLLSGGEQQMLAFGRALMADPKVLLLDEPSMGLAPIMIDVIMEHVRGMTERGLGILMVEQNASAVLEIAAHATVMEQGEVVLSGTGSEIANDAGVVRAYLGLEDLAEEAN